MATGISSRVFGEDIPLDIKDKLWLRQQLNKNSEMFSSQDAIQSPYSKEPDGTPKTLTIVNYNTSFDGEADLSSRTPFARIWCALEIVKRETLDPAKGNTYKKLLKAGYLQPGHENNTGNHYCDGKADSSPCYKYVPNVEGGSVRIYTIGNNLLNTFDVKPGDSIVDNATAAGGAQPSTLLDMVAPEEQTVNYNEFLRPPAGITGVSSETEGMLGAIKKTTVSFTVHNFHDFDKIYSQYFLKHGAELFVDFGWDTGISELYDPAKLIKDNGADLDNALYGPTGHVTKAKGDLETVIGVVINYDAKIKENGSVECSVDIVSKNAALLDRNFSDENDTLKNKIKNSIDMEMIRFAAKMFKGENVQKLLKANWTLSTESQKAWNTIYHKFAFANLHGDPSKSRNTPGSKSIAAGVYFGGDKVGNAKQLYISWGLFEDHILNKEFGFGDVGDLLGLKEKPSKTFQSRFDSSNSFVRWDRYLYASQQTRDNLNSETVSDRLNFLYPYKWNPKGDGSKYGTYNTHRGKVFHNDDRSDWDEDTKKFKLKNNITTIDKKSNRIPLRELFISTNLIKDALAQSTKSITDFMKYILDGINQSSQEIFDLQLGTNKYVSDTISIIDRNFVGTKNSNKKHMLDTLFIFKPTSPNSIVKGYDVSFSSPQGGLQNMLAIQGMAGAGKVFPVTQVMDNILAAEASHIPDAGELASRRVRYLPFVGGYRGEILHEVTTADTYIQLHTNNDIAFNKASRGQIATLESKAGKYTKTETDFLLNPSDTQAKKVSTDSVVKPAEEQDAVADQLQDGDKLAEDTSEYWAFKAKGDFYAQNRSSIIQLKLSLSIYGISSLVPGDLFRVDYLPQRYLDTVYFQVIQISHDISNSTWTTKIESVMRISADRKQHSKLWYQPSLIIVNPTVLEGELGKEFYTKIKPYVKKLIIQEVPPVEVVTNIGTLLSTEKTVTGVNIFQFKATKNGTLVLNHRMGTPQSVYFDFENENYIDWNPAIHIPDMPTNCEKKNPQVDDTSRYWVMNEDGFKEAYFWSTHELLAHHYMYLTNTAVCNYSQFWSQEISMVADATYHLVTGNGVTLVVPHEHWEPLAYVELVGTLSYTGTKEGKASRVLKYDTACDACWSNCSNNVGYCSEAACIAQDPFTTETGEALGMEWFQQNAYCEFNADYTQRCHPVGTTNMPGIGNPEHWTILDGWNACFYYEDE